MIPRGLWIPWPLPLFLLAAFLGACKSLDESDMTMLQSRVEAMIADSGGEVALYYRDLEGTDSLLIHPDERMHAASTMKVPVMIQLFADREAGLLDLDRTLTVKTTFSSIVDGSPYSLSPLSDSDTTLYLAEGEQVTYRHLINLMITVSSNLATNILIEAANAERVTSTMHSLGADSMVVLRGVEDGPAFEAGLSNTTTARDLGTIMSALGRGEVVSPAASEEMLEIMSRQKWRAKIPAKLPEGVRVAHKTGRITGISHDSGVIFPFEAPPYSLVVMTRGFEDPDRADGVAAEISLTIFDHHTRKH